MAIRVITSLVGLVVFFAILLSGILPFNIAICIVAAVMLYEFFKSSKCGTAVSFVGYLSSAAILISNFTRLGLYMGILISISIFLITMLIFHGKKNSTEIFSCAFETYFVTFFMSAVMAIRREYDIFGVLIIFICAWTTDTGAYFAGRYLGKHKLIPHVSPKKTVEGAIGGIVTSMLCCALYLFIMTKINMTLHMDGINYISIIIIGAVASVFSQLGDLIASAIKRDCGVKDFGNILPGHGGVLDRFDSVLFVSPFVYFLLKLFI